MLQRQSELISNPSYSHSLLLLLKSNFVISQQCGLQANENVVTVMNEMESASQTRLKVYFIISKAAYLHAYVHLCDYVQTMYSAQHDNVI